ncbi:MAG: TonB family protein [Aquificae bacterium]|nr:TonB family protein [Aquificota bacterium]
MRLIAGLLVSVVLHLGLLYAFSKIDFKREKQEVRQVNVSFLKIEEEVRKKKVEKVEVVKKVKREKRRIIKKTPAKRKKLAKKVSKPEREKPKQFPQPKKTQPKVLPEENSRQKEIREPKVQTTELEPTTETTRTYAKTYSQDYGGLDNFPVGIGEEEEEEEFEESYENYEEEFAQENLKKIRDIVQRYISYPPIARRMGWEGTVVVKFKLTPEGAVQDSEVEESSGYEILDKNALQVISRASSEFPKPRQTVVVVVPIKYKLE